MESVDRQMKRLNLRHLEVFRLVMEKGSVTDAAQTLNITQPAVSKALGQLEKTFGFSLFGRLHGRLHPTGEAHRLNAEISSLFDQVTLFQERMSGLREGREGKLTISAIPSLAISVVSFVIARFLRERPNVRVELFSEIAGRVVDDVVHHRSDLGFAHYPLSTDAVEEQLMGESEMVCMMRDDHPLASNDVLTPILLKERPLILLDRWAPPSHLVRECFAQSGVSPLVVVEANPSVAAKTIARLSNAVAIIDPWPMIVDPSPDLVMRPFRPRVPLRIMCLHSSYRPMSRVAQHFAEYMQLEMGRASRDSPFIRRKDADSSEAEISTVTPMVDIR